MFKNGQKIFWRLRKKAQKHFFGFFLASFISIHKKKSTPEQFLQDRPAGLAFTIVGRGTTTQFLNQQICS